MITSLISFLQVKKKFSTSKMPYLSIKKKKFFNIILFKATELLPPLPQMKSYMKTQSVDPVKGVGVLIW